VERSGKIIQVSDGSQTHGIITAHSRYLLVLTSVMEVVFASVCLLIFVGGLAQKATDKFS